MGEGGLLRPAGRLGATHHAEDDAAFYWVHDEPLLSYLGVKATEPRFKPTLYPGDQARAELHKVEEDPEARRKSRVSVLLANKPSTRRGRSLTCSGPCSGSSRRTPFSSPPPRVRGAGLHHRVRARLLQPDRRRDRRPGQRQECEAGRLGAGSAFVTPPGLWHSHHNESGSPAHLMPIQDAGLHTYLRTLDIKFFHKDHRAYISQK